MAHRRPPAPPPAARPPATPKTGVTPVATARPPTTPNTEAEPPSNTDNTEDAPPSKVPKLNPKAGVAAMDALLQLQHETTPAVTVVPKPNKVSATAKKTPGAHKEPLVEKSKASPPAAAKTGVAETTDPPFKGPPPKLFKSTLHWEVAKTPQSSSGSNPSNPEATHTPRLVLQQSSPPKPPPKPQPAAYSGADSSLPEGHPQYLMQITREQTPQPMAGYSQVPQVIRPATYIPCAPSQVTRIQARPLPPPTAKANPPPQAPPVAKANPPQAPPVAKANPPPKAPHPAPIRPPLPNSRRGGWMAAWHTAFHRAQRHGRVHTFLFLNPRPTTEEEARNFVERW